MNDVLESAVRCLRPDGDAALTLTPPQTNNLTWPPRGLVACDGRFRIRGRHAECQSFSGRRGLLRNRAPPLSWCEW